MDSIFKASLQPFLDTTTNFEDSDYVIFGAPIDITSSHRSGSRFAPVAIRQASQFMETYSMRTRLDLDSLSFSDVGNIVEIESIENALKNIQEAIQKIQGHKKRPVMLGGEHTVTLGAVRTLRPDLLIIFDAHLDLRDQLLGIELSHGTYLRRAYEVYDFKIAIIGARALSKEEKTFAESHEDRIQYVRSSDLSRGGSEVGIEAIQKWLDESETVYLTIDIDVLDPAYAPAAANPAPEGIGLPLLLDILYGTVDERLLGFDLTEVSPHYDSGLTPIQAAHIVLETMYYIESSIRA